MRTRRIDLFLGPAGHSSKVLLDGAPIENCRSIRVIASVGEATKVQIDLINIEAYVHSDDLLDGNVECFDVTPITADKRSYVLLKQIQDRENDDNLRWDDNGGKPS